MRFAEYVREPTEQEGQGGTSWPRYVWRRVPQKPVVIEIPLASKADEAAISGDGILLPNVVGIRLIGQIKPVHETGRALPAGTRALSLFLVNRRNPEGPGRADQQFIFQVEFALQCHNGFVARANLANEHSNESDERIADLQFRGHCEYAVGHGVSVDIVKAPEPSVCVTTVRTAWLPTYEVRRITTHDEPGVQVGMEALAELTAEDLSEALGKLPQAYTAWLDEQDKISLDSEDRRETRKDLIHRARRACARIQRGIDVLAQDPEALEAFCTANRAMAASARQRSPDRYQEGKVPEWRLFQLAFLLLNIEGVVNDRHPRPRRGGAHLLSHRRRQDRSIPRRDCVLSRASPLARTQAKGQGPWRGGDASLHLAPSYTRPTWARGNTCVRPETLRRKAPSILGDARFAVGLWVGRSATDNTMEQASKSVTKYKQQTGANPCPLGTCPWCNVALGPNSLELLPSRTAAEEVRLGCLNDHCEFCRANHDEGIPVIFVDEQVYRELPCFLIATVDKFAMLPWRGETAMLFGQALARGNDKNSRQFFGATDIVPDKATRLPEGLRPPELIVQDELHLISGPLGTMVGLYETAVEALCSLPITDGDGKKVFIRPKIIAATATVRRAAPQIQALYGRDANQVAIFPPPAVDDSETFFATIDHSSPGRMYLGVAAQGRSMKAILLRAFTALLAASARAYDPAGPEQQNPDGYMTVAG